MFIRLSDQTIEDDTMACTKIRVIATAHGLNDWTSHSCVLASQYSRVCSMLPPQACLAGKLKQQDSCPLLSPSLGSTIPDNPSK